VPLIQWVPGRGAGTAGITGGYTPAQMRANYDLGPVYAAGLNGKGRTIGIVDVYGSPTIRADLATFDAHYGIPAPPSFTIIEPAGKVPKFNRDNAQMVGWAGETTLDVEWSHAMAPGAAIVLAVTGVDEVEGTSGFPEIMSAEQYMIEHEHVSVISQSFAATEETFPTVASLMALRGVYGLAESRGVTVLGAAGDWGATSQNSSGGYYDRRVVNWPASDPLVTAVGGTRVFLNAAGGETEPPQVWNDDGIAVDDPLSSGGGVSVDFARPSWQSGVASVVGTRRGIPDVSLDASCEPGAEVYSSFTGFGSYGAVCGTSLASPLFAGIVVLADELAGRPLGLLNPTLYRLGADHAAGLVDITRGNNSVLIPDGSGTAVVTGYTAVAGYDLASGWGTVEAADLVPELAGKALP
jgi:subtilase family serine protease